MSGSLEGKKNKSLFGHLWCPRGCCLTRWALDRDTTTKLHLVGQTAALSCQIRPTWRHIETFSLPECIGSVEMKDPVPLTRLIQFDLPTESTFGFI